MFRLAEEGKTHWAQGAFTASTVEATAMMNAKALGKLEMLEGLIELDFESFGEAINERNS